MGADLGDALVGDDGDAVCVLNGRQSMCDHHRGVVVDLVETVEGFLHHLWVEKGVGRAAPVRVRTSTRHVRSEVCP